MKNLIYLFCFVFLISCNTDNESNESDELFENNSKSFEELINTQIGSIEDNKISLDISDENLLESFRIHAKRRNIDPENFKVVKIDLKWYLRFYNKDESVTTIALIKSKNPESGRIYLGNTECTSSACSSGGGCVPDGLYCTECNPPSTHDDSGIKGDCSRTTSS